MTPTPPIAPSHLALLPRAVALALLATAIGASTGLQAETLRWARAGDSLTLDPHAQNEGPTHTLAHQMYEGLLQRDMSGEIIPALATDWAVTDDPTVWRFELREGVTFHEGQDFDADDVVFSVERAMKPTSAMKELLTSVKQVRKVNDLTVEIVTTEPNPLLPANLTNLFMMDQGWTTENGSAEPQDFSNGGDNFAASNVNGTGAYRLSSRTVDERTVLNAFEDYWGKDTFPLEVTEIVYTPIQSAATRVAALLSGEVDLIQDVPVQDIGRVEGQDGLKVSNAPQNRTIFLGMEQGKADLESDDIDGENPFASREVREAMNLVIDRAAIQRVVMRDQSDPTGVIVPPFANGWTEELGALPDGDLEAAKQLMADAGYADGFSVQLDCPNDRYINDEAICQAVTGMFARIGIQVNLDSKPKAQHFPLINNKTTEFYMLGWGVPTFDSEYVFNFLVHTPTENRGSWNATGYSNAELDQKIQSLSAETDLDARNATIAEIWDTVQAETIYLPIHNQVLNWGMNAGIDFEVQPEDQPHFKFLSYAD